MKYRNRDKKCEALKKKIFIALSYMTVRFFYPTCRRIPYD